MIFESIILSFLYYYFLFGLFFVMLLLLFPVKTMLLIINSIIYILYFNSKYAKKDKQKEYVKFNDDFINNIYKKDFRFPTFVDFLQYYFFGVYLEY